MTLCWVARAVTHLPSSDGIYLILYMSYFSKTTPLPDSPSHLTVASQDEAGGEVLKVDHHCCVASAATQGDATGATGAKAWCAVWGSPKWRVFIMGNTSVNGWFGGSHSLGNPIVEDDLYISLHWNRMKSAIAWVFHASFLGVRWSKISSGFSTFAYWPVFEKPGFAEHVIDCSTGSFMSIHYLWDQSWLVSYC